MSLCQPLNRSLLLLLVTASLVTVHAAPVQAQVARGGGSRDGAGAAQTQAISFVNQMRHRLAAASATIAAAAVDGASATDARGLTGTLSGTISGTVAGLTDAALEGAFVTAWTDSPGAEYAGGYGKVGVDGSYVIEALVPGDYFVTASAEGYEILFYDNARDLSDATTVAVGDAAVGGIDFAMEAIRAGAGMLSGVVRSDTDQLPISGASVYAFDPNDPARAGAALTGPDGSYTIVGLHAGNYFVQVYANGFISEFFDDAASYEDAVQVAVTDGGLVQRIDFAISAGGSITGYVHDDDGTPVVGATISAGIPWTADSTLVVGPDGQACCFFPGNWTATDENGFYRVEGLPEGDYIVSAQTWTSWSYASVWYDGAAVPDDATPVHVAEGTETAGIDMTLPIVAANSAIAGRVTDAGGDPVPDAFVSAEQASADGNGGMERPFSWGYAVTDRDGRYAIEAIPAGTYRIVASAQVGWEYVQRWYQDAASPEQATPVEVGENARVEGIDVALPSSAALSGISGAVRDSDGTPLTGAFVEAMPDGGRSDGGVGGGEGGGTDGSPGVGSWGYGISDSTGAYTIDRLAPGSYLVHASYWSNDSFGQSWYDGVERPEDAKPVVLGEVADLTEIDFSVPVRPMYGSVEGTVTNDAGLHIGRAYVELSPVARDLMTDAPIWYASTHAVTDDEGRYKIERVAEGTYHLAVYANGGFEYFDDVSAATDATPVEVVGGVARTVDVALATRSDGTAEITGNVTGGTYAYDAAGDASPGITAPLEIAVVVAWPATVVGSGADPRNGYAAVSAPDGTYRLIGLAPGDYVVSSFAPWHVGEYYDDAYSPSDATVISVDGTQAVGGVDFELWPAYFLAPETDAGRSAVVVYGVVTDEDGSPVEGATVYVLNGTEQPLASVRTGADGAFEITGLIPGMYSLYAGKIGYTGTYNGEAPSFAAAEPIPMNTGRIEVNLVMQSGTGTGIDEEPALPQSIELLGNYPNPFNPETAILLKLSEPSPVRLTVYDVLGEEIAVLVDGPVGAGLQTFHWNGESRRGTPVASGTYFYRVESASATVTGSMILVR